MSDYRLELEHHGILGQKWGVRRFQNADGTRTAAGKKRYGEHRRNTIDRAVNRSNTKTEKKVVKLSGKKESADSEKKKARLEKKIDRVETANRRVSSGARITNRALDTIGRSKLDKNIKKTDSYKTAKSIVRNYNFHTGGDYYWTYYTGGISNLIGQRDKQRTASLRYVGKRYEKNQKFRNRVDALDS